MSWSESPWICLWHWSQIKYISLLVCFYHVPIFPSSWDNMCCCDHRCSSPTQPLLFDTIYQAFLELELPFLCGEKEKILHREITLKFSLISWLPDSVIDLLLQISFTPILGQLCSMDKLCHRYHLHVLSSGNLLPRLWVVMLPRVHIYSIPLAIFSSTIILAIVLTIVFSI